jgi:hypothetical protein
MAFIYRTQRIGDRAQDHMDAGLRQMDGSGHHTPYSASTRAEVPADETDGKAEGDVVGTRLLLC